MEPAARFRILAVAAFADGEPKDEEKQVLVSLAVNMGVPLREAAHVLNEVAGGKTRVEQPRTPAEKDEIFSGLVQVVLADGQVTPRERAIVTRLGLSFGYDQKTIEAALKPKPGR